ncbi:MULTISPECIES: ParB/RepB/Spo0J family partition protein [unclassified Phenylobacterium]|uniref:ParB/RepB/Spo0J family partition protein n=1 Tax=unclassified Phenylobacterium TaxID=2640670 RepID=UPI00083ABD9B|nr:MULTISPECIES: ParB/RepB/Spo0J family partition protein [unclassified Phenylobacterium]
MPATASLPEAQPERLPKSFPLRDLAIAPENMRFSEPPDDEIPELAETIFAAGVLQPLTVRPGKKNEKPGMALDGRRRWLALQLLLEAGRISDDYPVPAFVETDPARQAAAIVLTNTAVPVHLADVIVAIGKMTKAKLTSAVIAAALGYAEVEVRRLSALSELHPKALEALKAGRLNLRQARLLARLPNRKEQGEIAEAVLNGFGFQEWRITDRLDAGQVTIRDRRFKLVGADRYVAAGGRIETDLFAERPDVVLDPEVPQAAWLARAETLASGLLSNAVQVLVAVAPSEITDPDLEAFGDAYGMGLDAEALSAWDQAQDAAQDAASALHDRDLSDEAADPDIAAFLEAKLAADVAGEPTRDITLVQVFSDAVTGLDVRAFGPPAAAVEDDEEVSGPLDLDETGDEPGTVAFEHTPPLRRAVSSAAPVAVAPAPELEGVNHVLHDVRTDTATRALIRALADDPAVALTALIARLFGVLVLRQNRGKGGGALAIEAESYARVGVSPIEALDGEVRRRLAERRAAWEAAEVSPIAWVDGLAHGEKMALLAELVALSLDLREERTTSVRRAARAEAVEIAALCAADVTLHWTPDAAFLGAHPKPKLFDMLDEMGAGESRAGACKKDELVALVAERAAERGWAPAYLSWAAEPPAEPEPDEEPLADPQAASGADGVGAPAIAA